MIKNYNTYLKEGLLDYLKGKSKDEIIDSLKDKDFDYILKKSNKYNLFDILPKERIPNGYLKIKELNDILLDIGYKSTYIDSYKGSFYLTIIVRNIIGSDKYIKITYNDLDEMLKYYKKEIINDIDFIWKIDFNNENFINIKDVEYKYLIKKISNYLFIDINDEIETIEVKIKQYNEYLNILKNIKKYIK